MQRTRARAGLRTPASARRRGVVDRERNGAFAFAPGYHARPGAPDGAITVGIIEDNRLMREAITAMLGTLADVRVVASQGADPAVAAVAAEAKPNVLLLDVGLRDRDSLSVAAALMKEAPDAKIIVIDLVPVNEDIVEFVNAGVSGFVLKDAGFDEFVGTIRAVAAGEKVLPLRMTESLFSQIATEGDGPRGEHAPEEVRITPREREVIELIGEGLSNKEIAHQLNIRSYTVKSHVRNVMEKLALHTRLQIAAYAHRGASRSAA